MFQDPNRYDIEEFLNVQGWVHRSEGTQHKVQICPYCGKDKYHFYINQETGLFDCKVCGVSGSLWKLKKDHGTNILSYISTIIPKKEEKYPDREAMLAHRTRLLSNQVALDYLGERGFTPQTIERFYLGLSEDGKIAIPIIKDGTLVNIKYRTIPPAEKFYMREKGCPSYLFNADAIMAKKDIILTEGEFDAMAADQLGFVAVSGVTGASSGLTPGEMKQLDKAERVIVIYDSDEAGQNGAMKVIDRIGQERCINVVLPVKDMNEYLLSGGTKGELVEFIRAADKVKPDNVVSFNELLQELEKHDSTKGNGLGYPMLDEQFSGLGPGKFTIIAGDTRVGKSTFAMNVFKNLVMDNVPVLIFSLENQPAETVKRVSSMLMNKPFHEITKEEIEGLKDLYAEWKMFFFFSGDKDVNMDLVRQTAIQAKKYYGVQAIMIDHIQFFSRNISNQAGELSLLVLQMKRLAVSLGIPIVAISHISRKENANRIPTIHDLKGSSSIEQDADQVLVLWRNLQPVDNPDLITEEDKAKYAAEQSEMLVRIHKDRNGQGYGDFWFNYELATGLITEKIK